jgi:hypothetical protein
MSLILSGSDGLSDVDGSASTPAIRGTDTNTGIFFPAADTIAFSEGGAEVMRLTSTGSLFVKTADARIGSDVGSVEYGTSTTNSVKFFSDNTERMRIDSSGNLLVGTTDSSGTSGGGVKIKPDTVFGANIVNIVGSATSNSFQGLYLYSTGAGAARFYVGYGGTIYATSTSITAISDASLKENVRDLDTGLTQVLALKPRRFDWKEETAIEEKDVAGFIAQEVADVLPELVYDYQYNETETKKALKMGDMLPTLVKAIQEQQAIITDLKSRIEALEAK